MFTVMEESGGKVIGIKVEGKIQAEDYDTMIPVLEDAIERDGPISLYCDMTGYAGFTFGAAVRDAKFGFSHMRDFAKMAVVGGPAWIKRWVRWMAPLFRIKAKVFEASEAETAWTWLKAA